MSYELVAERYARAVFELGQESGQLRELVEQIRSIGSTYAASAELRSVLENPFVEAKQREAILGDVAARLGLGQLARNTLRLLAQRRRLRALPEIARRLGALADVQAGIVRATVTSATPLGESFYQKIGAELERATGKRVVVERHTDPTLVGGVITRLGDNTIDGSIMGRLGELHRQLVAG